MMLVVQDAAKKRELDTTSSKGQGHSFWYQSISHGPIRLLWGFRGRRI